MSTWRIFVMTLIACSACIAACSFQDQELDRELAKYRGSGIQRDGDRMPRRTPDDEAN